MLAALRKNRRPRDLLLVFELLAITLLFFLNKESEALDGSIIYLAVGLILIIYISNFVLGRITSGDNYIFLIVSMLLSIGIITAFRINPQNGLKQLIWALAGILLFYSTYFIVKFWRNLEKLGNLYNEVQKRVNEILGGNSEKQEIYIVKKGDCLSSIAKEFKTTVNKIAEDNGITNVDLIYTGQKLIIKR